MSRLSLVVSLLLGALLMSGSAFSAQSVTALYRVAKVQHVLKLIDDKCVEEEKKKRSTYFFILFSLNILI